MNYDQFMAALCLWREARGASKVAKAGIYQVILNRTTDTKNRWPKMVHKVVIQPRQFSSFNLGEVNSVKFPIEGMGADWMAWQECVDVVTLPLGGDHVMGANHYESIKEGDPLPMWARPDAIVARIGPFRFYRL